MRPIPLKLRKEMGEDPYYKKCIYERDDAPNHDCVGRVEFEHAWIYAGRQVNEKWAIVPCCKAHNSGQAMVKRFNKYVSINRATDADFAKYPRRDWQQEKKSLNNQYETIIKQNN